MIRVTPPKTRIQLGDGDKVIFEPDVEQYLICCDCGCAHRISFNHPVTMTIWAANELTAKERKKILKA